MSCGNIAQISSICRRGISCPRYFHADGDKAAVCPFSGNDTSMRQLELRAEREMR